MDLQDQPQLQADQGVLLLPERLELRLSVLGDPVDPVDLEILNLQEDLVLGKNLLEYNLYWPSQKLLVFVC